MQYNISISISLFTWHARPGRPTGSFSVCDREHVLVPTMEEVIVISYNESEPALPVIEPASPAVSPVKRKLKTECGSTNLGASGEAT